ncbi:BPL-N domain-containing protein [Candidatus Protochlamydia phocaeensis]|uniref:BPL-N domain-containing protein n=1 Tax=Candidatus Protochlamydia phocaeensis TaxID=1414722 RepID=UPI000837CE8F|nr:BPL-N domain-containing protein [Candidatus Protochlamydia phocaeensis]
MVSDMNLGLSSIYLFKGEGESYQGVDRTGVENLEKLLQVHFPASALNLIDNAGVVPDQWNASNSLFVLPGGKCSDWTWVNTSGIVEKTRQFVENGGKVFAACAGAYCLCQRSEYTSSTYCANHERGFNFFSGKGIGPLIDSPFSHPIVEAVKVQMKDLENEKNTGYVVLAGGGYFEPDKNPVYPYEVLASYQGLAQEKSIAAVEVKVGKGRVWLSFPHFENSVKDYPLNALKQTYFAYSSKWEKTHKRLNKGEDFRLLAIHSIMQRIHSTFPEKA